MRLIGLLSKIYIKKFLTVKIAGIWEVNLELRDDVSF